MIFIREDAIYQAFVTMINKLIFSHKIVLRPLLQKLKSMSYSDNLAQVQEIEAKIEDNAEQLQVLMNLMTKGYLEPVLFNSQNNELRMRAQNLKEQKEILYKSINGGLTKVTELERLIKYVSKAKDMEAFNEELFKQFVEKIIVFSPTEIGFSLKCGLLLRERMVR
jgi:site-specific DNA recombinase